jgi:uncharacterized protein (TIGR02246 family)
MRFGILALILISAGGSAAAANPRCAPADSPAARSAIEALNAEFAWLIDHDQSDRVAELFTADGKYTAPGQNLAGRSSINAAYRNRAARGVRTSRHIFTNMRLRPLANGMVGGTSIMLLFGQDGPPPHPAKPLGVTDYDDVYVCERDGKWRYVSRMVTPLFEDPDRKPVLLQAK